jgi:hypothetical protein
VVTDIINPDSRNTWSFKYQPGKELYFLKKLKAKTFVKIDILIHRLLFSPGLFSILSLPVPAMGIEPPTL